MIKKFPIIIPAGLHDTGISTMLQPVGMTDLVLGALAVLFIRMVEDQRKWFSIECHSKDCSRPFQVLCKLKKLI